ncbi:MAG: hypothetical protein EBS32_12565, partial [Actinobacteria bacterium]|nr:hypothetical protein [Actinomycetota bacterium]
AATFLGTDAVQGLTAQTGMILQNQDASFSTERRYVVDSQGEKVGLCLWGDELNVTLEALASGTPVIASREGASPCLLTSSSGRLVGSDPTDVARKVLDIVSLTRIDVSDSCREHALTFTWRTAATRILSAHVPELELRRAG